MSYHPDPDRGTGRTTRQLKEAQKDTIYVVFNHSEVEHTKRMALALGRPDILVRDISFLSERRWHGTIRPVEMDHHALDNCTHDTFVQWQACLAALAAKGL